MRARSNRDRFQLHTEQLESRELLAANAFEQHAVYLINLERNERDLPPFAINGRLMESSENKAENLDTCFSSTCNGEGPSDLAQKAGYDASVNEVLAQFAPPGDASDQAATVVDTWMANASFRNILLGNKSEIGVGRSLEGNRVYWAAHVGTSDPDATYLTGVTYSDRNDNGRYDYGEGLAGNTVNVGNQLSTTTNAGSGWKVSVDPNSTYKLSASGGSLNEIESRDVRVQSESRSVDFAVGTKAPIVDFAGVQDDDSNGDTTDDTTGNSGGDSDVADESDSIPRNKGRVSGYVFADANSDGIRNSNEEGLTGWNVYVDENANGLHDKREKSTLTDENGRYELDLRPMRLAGFGHQVTIELQSTYVNTSQTRHSVVIEKGVHKSGKNFGVQRTSGGDTDSTSTVTSLSPYGRVSGRVFLDQDENGIKATDEDRLAGWVVYVDSNGNGVRDATDPQKTTDSSGRYEFELLPNELEGFGSRVSVVMKSGFENTTKTSRSVLVEAGVHKTNKDFGVVRNNGISGFVFRDGDGDGTLDAGEAKRSGQTVFIDANNNGRLDAAESSTRTNQNGKYEFKSVSPGSYTVVVAATPGFEFTVGNTRTVSVQANRISSERNFGVRSINTRPNRPPQAATRNTAQISGRLFEDANGDGERSNTEQKLANWRIYIDANRNGRRDANEPSMLTDDTGRYEFSLPVGVYRIAAESKGTFAFTTNQIRSVDITNGTDKRQRDFGVIRPSSAAVEDVATLNDTDFHSTSQTRSQAVADVKNLELVSHEFKTFHPKPTRTELPSADLHTSVKVDIVDQALLDWGASF